MSRLLASSPSPEVHLVELDGRGGVYQHAVALADALHAAGVRVVLHTATDPELLPMEPLEVCRCMDWRRDAGSSRRVLVGGRFLVVTLPHLVRTRGVLHVQGPFKSALLVALHFVRRLLRRHLAFSPHNTFSRRGSALDARCLRLCARMSHATIVFSQADAVTVARWGASPVVSPLLLPVPTPAVADVQRWRARWGAGPVVLFAGQVRPDKRLHLLIAASALWTQPSRLAIVGADLGRADGGYVEQCRRLAARTGVDPDWSLGYRELRDFLAAVAAADVVVCPYDQASQSGVLAVAHQLGVPTIACDVGGLVDVATVVVPRSVSSASLARAIDELIASPPPRKTADPVDATVTAHRIAYSIEEPLPATGVS